MKLAVQKVCVLVSLFLFITNGRTTSPDTKRDQAWEIIQANAIDKSTEKRAVAIRVLGLLPGDARALKLVDAAATDEKGCHANIRIGRAAKEMVEPAEKFP